MSLRYPIERLVCCLLIAPSCVGTTALAQEATERAPRRVIRICADPNNLPFTNRKLEGFENRIADVLASELDADLHYVWRAQRRGFFRESLKERSADLVLGVPTGYDMALTTRPYYRSTYVFVTPRNKRISSLDDHRLPNLKIGVQLVGDDGMNPPAAHALARRGLIDNVVGYTVYGDYAEENPPARIVDAVVSGDVDAAIVWGPLAGYFAKQHARTLEVTPVTPETDPPALTFCFSVSMGVSRDNSELRDEIDAALVSRKREIDEILDDFGIPTVAIRSGGEEGEQ